MTKTQIAKAAKLASENDLVYVDDSILHGLALPDFKPVIVTLPALVYFIGYHCKMFNGGWDNEALNEMSRHLKTKVMLAN